MWLIRLTVDQMWDMSKREESKMDPRCFAKGSMDLPLIERRRPWEDEAW